MNTRLSMRIQHGDCEEYRHIDCEPDISHVWFTQLSSKLHTIAI